MASTRTQRWGPVVLLAGDAGLLTAAAVCLALEPGALRPGALGLLGSVLLWIGSVALVLAPLLAWWLHGRRVDGTATLGAILGFIAGAVVVYSVLALLAFFVGLSGTDVPGPVLVVGVAVLVAAYLVVIVWLDVEALRDLLRKRRTHVPLDLLRLLATVAYVAVIVGVVAWAAGTPPPETDRVPIVVFLVGPAAMGAAAAAGADLAVRRREQQSHAHLIPGA